MPHIIIEYAAALSAHYDIDVLCKSLCDAGLASGVFKTPQDVKVRAIPASHWYQPVENQIFVHITVRLMEGRTSEQKSKITNAILDEASSQLPTVGSITVDIKEIHLATYAKRTN